MKLNKLNFVCAIISSSILQFGCGRYKECDHIQDGIFIQSEMVASYETEGQARIQVCIQLGNGGAVPKNLLESGLYYMKVLGVDGRVYLCGGNHVFQQRIFHIDDFISFRGSLFRTLEVKWKRTVDGISQLECNGYTWKNINFPFTICIGRIDVSEMETYIKNCISQETPSKKDVDIFIQSLPRGKKQSNYISINEEQTWDRHQSHGNLPVPSDPPSPPTATPTPAAPVPAPKAP